MSYVYNPLLGAGLDQTGAGGGGGTPGGSTTQVQFNDSNSFGGDDGLTFNKTTNVLTVGASTGNGGSAKVYGDINLDDGGSFTTTVQCVTPTANRTISFPDATGTVALVAGSSGQLLWNNAGANAGASTLTYDGSILTSSGRFINSYNATASNPAKVFTGTWFTGGTATTTKPHFLVEPTGTTSTAWSTSGTGLGVNAASGFAGNLLDLQVNGTSQVRVSSAGDVFIGAASIGKVADSGTFGPGFNFGLGTSLVFRREKNSTGNINFSNSANFFEFGSDSWSATPSSCSISSGWAAGTNIAGSSLTVRSGVATGNATPGSVIFGSTQVGSSGTTRQSFAELLRINGANQNITFGGTTSGFPALKRNSTVLETKLADDSAYAQHAASVFQAATAHTVATLPGAPTVGMIARVTDATAPAVGSTVTGGGAAAALVWYNGANWTVIGV